MKFKIAKQARGERDDTLFKEDVDENEYREYARENDPPDTWDNCCILHPYCRDEWYKLGKLPAKPVKTTSLVPVTAKKVSIMNREAWLSKLADQFRTEFECNGYKLKPYRVSCGLPSRSAFSKNKKRIGECWYDQCSDDQHHEIFVSPTIADSVNVGAVLLHELCHVACGCKAGHKAPFRKCATIMGLEGKMTATTPGTGVTESIKRFAKSNGEFPHATLNGGNGSKKQATRQLKAVCVANDCSCLLETTKPYIVRMSKTTYDIAPPICGCCQSPMELE